MFSALEQYNVDKYETSLPVCYSDGIRLSEESKSRKN